MAVAEVLKRGRGAQKVFGDGGGLEGMLKGTTDTQLQAVAEQANRNLDHGKNLEAGFKSMLSAQESLNGVIANFSSAILWVTTDLDNLAEVVRKATGR